MILDHFTQMLLCEENRRSLRLTSEAVQRLAESATQTDLARTYGVSQATISRLQPNPFGVANVGVA
jgi:Trp operon repressor